MASQRRNGAATQDIVRDRDKTIVRLSGDLDFATVAEVTPVLERESALAIRDSSCSTSPAWSSSIRAGFTCS